MAAAVVPSAAAAPAAAAADVHAAVECEEGGDADEGDGATDASGFDETTVRLCLHDILLCIQRDAVRHASTNDHEWGSVAETTATAAEGEAVLVALPAAEEPAEDCAGGGSFAHVAIEAAEAHAGE